MDISKTIEKLVTYKDDKKDKKNQRENCTKKNVKNTKTSLCQ